MRYLESYKVVLKYHKDTCRKTTLHTGLTLEQAQRICEDKESSWQTCTENILNAEQENVAPGF